MELYCKYMEKTIDENNSGFEYVKCNHDNERCFGLGYSCFLCKKIKTMDIFNNYELKECFIVDSYNHLMIFQYENTKPIGCVISMIEDGELYKIDDVSSLDAMVLRNSNRKER